jgi:C4-dicarboxylate-binding protein DctP
MMRNAILSGVVAVAMALCNQASAQQPIIIKFSHVVAPDTPKGKGALKFQELADKYTGGKVKVEVFANSTLYKDKEELEALQLGAVQMLAPSLAKFGPLGVKEFEVFDLPYIIPDKAALARVTKGKVAKELFAKLAPKGIEGLAYWDNGFKIMTGNKPMHHVADFHGMKMRIQSSKVLESEMRALGAIPQAMAFSEVYQAMSTGVVDGAENPPSNVYTQKMHEVQKHATMSNHGYVGYAVIVNKKFWDGLPGDIRSQVQKAMDDATDYANGIAQQENDDAIAAMKKAGTMTFYELTPDEKAEWMKAMQPVADEMASRIGKDLIEQFRREAGGGS